MVSPSAIAWPEDAPAALAPIARTEGAGLREGILYWPGPGGGAHWVYLPLFAAPQRNPDGSIQAQLFAAGEAGFLSLAAVWEARPEALERLRAALRAGLPPEAGPVMLSFAPVAVAGARLMLCGDAGEAREIARSDTSGMPPWSAFLSATLSGAERAAATAALGGQEGRLAVVYDATLPLPRRHAGRIEGDFAGVRDRAGLDAALATGQLTLTLPEADPGLAERMLDRAAELLACGVAGAGGRIEIEITTEERAAVPVAGDVGRWLAGAATAITPVPVLPGDAPPQTAPDPQNED